VKGARSLDLMDGAELASVGGDLPIVGVVLMGIGLLLFAIALLIFIVPALILIAELLLIAALVGIGLAGRVLFGRLWTVEAHQEGDDHAYEWKVAGWRASGELVRSIADQLRGTGLPTGGARVPSVQA
jgi:hypothetical protein